MKTLLTSAFILGISLFSLATPYSREKPADETLMELTSVRTHYEKVRITFKQAMDKVYISIIGPDGDLIARDKYKTKEPVVVPYDLSALPPGNYQVKIEAEGEVAVFDIKTEEKKEKVIYPLMAYGKIKDRNIISLMVVGLEKPGVTVNIYNQLNQKIRSEYIDQAEGFSKDYKILNQNAGQIFFHVTDSQGRSKYVYPKQK